jgi:hypothetical protein
MGRGGDEERGRVNIARSLGQGAKSNSEQPICHRLPRRFFLGEEAAARFSSSLANSELAEY